MQEVSKVYPQWSIGLNALNRQENQSTSGSVNWRISQPGLGQMVVCHWKFGMKYMCHHWINGGTWERIGGSEEKVVSFNWLDTERSGMRISNLHNRLTSNRRIKCHITEYIDIQRKWWNKHLPYRQPLAGRHVAIVWSGVLKTSANTKPQVTKLRMEEETRHSENDITS